MSYNANTKHTGVGKLSLEALRCYSPFLHFLAAVHEGAPLVIHATLMDADSGRARILHVASLFRNAQTTQERGFFGRAHRLLYWEEMQCCRERGIRYLNLGGYLPDTNDPKMRGINAFKTGLGWQVVEESNYLSCTIFLYRLIANGFRHVPRRLSSSEERVQ